jgi:tetratricopeptide (TPR) repeat protein
VGVYFFVILTIFCSVFVYSQYTITGVEKEILEVLIVTIGGIIYGIVIGALFSGILGSLSGIGIGMVAGLSFGILCAAIISPIFGPVIGVGIGIYVGINSYLSGMVFGLLNEKEMLKSLCVFILQISIPGVVSYYPIYSSKVKRMEWVAYEKGLKKKEEEHKIYEEMLLVRKGTPQGMYELGLAVAEEGKSLLVRGDYRGAQMIFESALRHFKKARDLAIRMGSEILEPIEKSIDELEKDITGCKNLRKWERAKELTDIAEKMLKKSVGLYRVGEYTKSIEESKHVLSVLREAHKLSTEIDDEDLIENVEKIRTEATQNIELCKIKGDYGEVMTLYKSASNKFVECKEYMARNEFLKCRELLREVETMVDDAISICLTRKFEDMLDELRELLAKVVSERELVLKTLREMIKHDIKLETDENRGYTQKIKES